MSGLVHIYCGDGKGKSTACVGLAVRQSGINGAKVLFVQFNKNGNSAEVKVLKKCEGITYMCAEESFGFSWTMSDEDKKRAAVCYTKLFNQAVKIATDEHYNLLVIDEAVSTINNKFIIEDDMLEFLHNKPAELEVVLSGRDPSDALIGAADYVSEIRKIKHPFDQGISSREGIEF